MAISSLESSNILYNGYKDILVLVQRCTNVKASIISKCLDLQSHADYDSTLSQEEKDIVTNLYNEAI